MNTLPFPGSGDESAQPQRIGRYEILDRIGHGSMGVVYLAQDPLIGRRVALKTLSRRQALGGAGIGALRDQLLNEAVSAGGLNHPGIVTIHDVVEDEAAGQVGIAMEYVPGRTLREVLAGPDIVSLNFTASVIQRVAEVLDFAHHRGVVHRDIKPANVILSDDRGLKIADFGIASLRGHDLARDLKAMGTPNYLAPERLLGHEADHRADIYSLGVLLYEMLTGHVPFQGESLAELARNTVEQDFIPPEIYRPDLLPGLRAILDRALAKDPDQRYQSAGDLASDLAAVVKAQARMSDTRPIEGVLIEGRATPDQRPRLVAGLRRAWRRLGAAAAAIPRPPIHLSRVAAWSALGLLVLLSTAGVYWLSNRPRNVSAAAVATPVDADEAKEQLRQLEYLSLLRRVQELYEGGQIEEAERLLAEAETVAPEVERIRRLRAEAYFNVEADRAVRRVAQTLQLLEAAEEAVDRGSFGTAEAALYKIFEIDPANEEALVLRERLAAAQEAVRRARRQRQDAEAAAELAARESRPQFEPFTVTEAPRVPEPEPFGTLKVDFRSEVPKGVLTVYAGTEQILRREYSFYEKRGLFRRRATSGGFDMQKRLPSGDLHLRVYVSGPGRVTHNRTLHEHLPGGGLRVLTVRVAEDGEVEVGFH